MYKTPILLIIFNRADTALQVVSRLREIKPMKVYVAADAERSTVEGEKEKCDWVRKQVLNAIDWECEIKTLFQEENLGCGMGPATAITWLFENEEQGIILEDDIVPLKSFFPFMEEMLEKYKDNEQIMEIGGNSMGVSRNENDADYYFSAYNHWAWATWRRAWQKFDYNMSDLDSFLVSGKIENYFKSPVQVQFWKYLFPQVKHMTSVWDYQWTYSIWNNKGLVVLPNVNLCKNIGFGEDATHSSYESESIANAKYTELKFPLKHPSEIIQDKVKDEEMTTNIYQAPSTKCPLTGFEVNKSHRIKIKPVIQAYAEKLNLNVKPYFENLEHLFLLESEKSAYRFFYPFQSVANLDFIKIYFHENEEIKKWFYYILNKITKKENSVLFFNENEKSNNNSDFCESIKDLKKIKSEKYNIVSSFHKIHHIPEIKEFIEQQIRILKPGGKLIISAPNQDSYIGHYFHIENMPPFTHSYWNLKSFETLEKFFPISIEKVYYNSIDKTQKKEFRTAINKRTKRILESRFKKFPTFIKSIIGVFLETFFKFVMKKGNSILVVFTKN